MDNCKNDAEFRMFARTQVQATRHLLYFLHAELEPHERIYAKIPRGFKQYDSKGHPKILSLLRFLYGLRNSPRAFW